MSVMHSYYDLGKLVWYLLVKTSCLTFAILRSHLKGYKMCAVCILSTFFPPGNLCGIKPTISDPGLARAGFKCDFFDVHFYVFTSYTSYEPMYIRLHMYEKELAWGTSREKPL